MSQLGMQMPGARRVRRVTPNVYTGLMVFAVVSLVAAVVLVGRAAMTIAPEAGPLGALKVHPADRSVQLAND